LVVLAVSQGLRKASWAVVLSARKGG